MKHKNLGFSIEKIAVFRILVYTIRRSIDSVKRELPNHSGVAGVVVSSVPPGFGNGLTGKLKNHGSENKKEKANS